MIALKMISAESDLQKETGLNHDGLCDAGFYLDDWDVCFVSEKPLGEDARWLVMRMDTYCVGYIHVTYNYKHYYMVYHS